MTDARARREGLAMASRRGGITSAIGPIAVLTDVEFGEFRLEGEL